jgi:hypothetical protein
MYASGCMSGTASLSNAAMYIGHIVIPELRGPGMAFRLRTWADGRKVVS